MIECKHKWQLQILNKGLDTWFCQLHQMSVNEDICSQCSDREGELPKPYSAPMEFPKRSDEEIAAIYQVCKGCPLHDIITKKCSKMPAEMHPTDIISQNPTNHCPEQLW